MCRLGPFRRLLLPGIHAVEVAYAPIVPNRAHFNKRPVPHARKHTWGRWSQTRDTHGSTQRKGGQQTTMMGLRGVVLVYLTCSACGRLYQRVLALQAALPTLCGLCVVKLRDFRSRVSRLAAERARVQAGTRSDWPGGAVHGPHSRHDVVIGRGSPTNQLDELLWDGFWMLTRGSRESSDRDLAEPGEPGESEEQR